MEFIIVSNLSAHMLDLSIKCQSCWKGLSGYCVNPQPAKGSREVSFQANYDTSL